ncbi:Arylsulfotransferase (ASST) [Rosistilla carotiformis]|uniref:Arylsulfotransferase (ASST) n=1 Tax=Rosistilla carotiformis TaxID=2528017 RepID=A0A518JPI0_9BACT|nr:PQQ-binding-like beta-propeller repeat protein [Rosistilla carotiformis]QDV67456.1 Arylsulfotransferase (ASST) [Rosistilla carotiformis]
MRTALPLAFAFLIFTNLSAIAQHRFLANQQNKLVIIDAQGKTEWEMTLSGAPHDLQLLDNGNILTHQNTEIIEIDPRSSEIVWRLDAKKFATVDRVEVHSVRAIPGDRIMIALSGEGKLLEIDRDGTLQHSIALQRTHPHPHRDTRLVRRMENGNYLVAQEGDGKVCEYDHDGKIVWQYDVPMFGRQRRGGHGPEAFGNSVFSALRLPNGNTLIGTGNGHSILEVTPEKEIVWKLAQNDLPGITLAWVTTLEYHPNGNIVFGNCHAGPDNPQLIEVNRGQEVLWQFHDFKTLGNDVSNSIVLDAAADVVR